MWGPWPHPQEEFDGKFGGRGGKGESKKAKKGNRKLASSGGQLCAPCFRDPAHLPLSILRNHLSDLSFSPRKMCLITGYRSHRSFYWSGIHEVGTVAIPIKRQSPERLNDLQNEMRSELIGKSRCI